MAEPGGARRDTSAPEAPGASGDARVHDLRRDIGGASPSSWRGGDGLGPQGVREADEHARTAGRETGGDAD